MKVKNNSIRFILVSTLVLLLLVVLSGLCLWKIEQYAYLYVESGWLVLITLFIRFSKTEKIRLIAIYSGSVFLAFFLGEVYFTYLDIKSERFEFQSIYGGHNTTREGIGLAPVKNSQWKTKLTLEDSLIFDVVQTIDNNGFRLTPQRITSVQSPVLFFGCSFTFGHGLNDDETLPAFLHASNPEQWNAINMGYDGYGVHQTLAMLETQMEKDLLREQIPKAAFYTAITDHVFRGVGRLNHNIGPKYKLDNKARVIPRDKESLNGRELKYKAKWLLAKSSLLRRVLFSYTSLSREEDIDLFIAMVEKASVIFSNRYNAPFYCLLWKEQTSQPGLYEILLQRLNEKRITVIEVNHILPGYQENPGKYLFYKDGHPNALANRLIAEHLNKLLIQ